MVASFATAGISIAITKIQVSVEVAGVCVAVTAPGVAIAVETANVIVAVTVPGVTVSVEIPDIPVAIPIAPAQRGTCPRRQRERRRYGQDFTSVHGNLPATALLTFQ